jgi:PBP1b-binding outer membrane lipoprotein LpoB
MKRTKLITTLAIGTLVFSACGNSEETATEPEAIEEQETEETTSDQESVESEASD